MKFNRRWLHRRMIVIEKINKILKREALQNGYHFKSRHRQIDKY